MLFGASVNGEDELVPHSVGNKPSLAETVTGPRRTMKLNARKKAFKRILAMKKGTNSSLPTHRAHHLLDRDVGNTSVPNGTWSVGDWGPCQVNCGTGSQYRSVECVDGAGIILVDGSHCDASSQPINKQTCTGSCLQCSANNMFLRSYGVGDVSDTPSHTPSDLEKTLCQVTSKFTCCSQETETRLLTGHTHLSRGLKAQTQHRDLTKQLVQDAYQNVSAALENRMGDTEEGIEKLNEAISAEPDVKSGDVVRLDTLRQSLLTALEQRSEMLSTAISDLSSLESAVLDQLDLLDSAADDDLDPPSSGEDEKSGDDGLFGSLMGLFSSESGAIGVSTISRFDDSLLHSVISAAPSSSLIHFDAPTKREGKKGSSMRSSFVQETKNPVALNFSDPKLRVFSKTCTEAVSHHFISLACSACNPSFPIQSRENNNVTLPPLTSVSTGSCTELFNACSDSLVAAHQRLSQGMTSLVNSQVNLVSQVSVIQPILQRVWAEISFDWLPGFSAVQMAQPDLTKMTCLNEILKFVPNEVSNNTALCTEYFTFASPKAFVKRIADLIDRGVVAMAVFSACDRCIGKTANFLADVLGPNSRSSLGISLPSKAKAMVAACSAPPAAVPTTSTWEVYKKLNAYERVSPVVRYSSAGSKSPQLSEFQNFSKAQVAAASMTPPSEWNLRTLALDSTNTTFRKIPFLNDTLKYVSADASLQLNVMNRNCTSHSECWDHNAPTGMRPWWFCAHPNACVSQPGGCSEAGLNLLSTGPKCVRGPCSSDLSAVDKQCPVNAVCPAESGSVQETPTPYFGQQYFSKFDLKMRSSDVGSVGAGVCDCAFSSTGAVSDACAHARCLAYASLMESTATCNVGLVSQCQEIVSNNAQCLNDVTLSCTDQEIILSYPPQIAGQCGTNPTALSDQTNSVGPEHHQSVFLVVAVLVLTAF